MESSVEPFQELPATQLPAFGGPGMIAHIKEMSVKRDKWLPEGTFKVLFGVTVSVALAKKGNILIFR